MWHLPPVNIKFEALNKFVYSKNDILVEIYYNRID